MAVALGETLVVAGSVARTPRHPYALDQGASTIGSGCLADLADEVGLRGALDDLHLRRRDVELAIYRAHHALAATSASPLALDVLAHDGVDAHALVEALRPGGDWRRWICGAWPPKACRYARWAQVPSPGEDEERDLFLHGCLVLREWGDPDGALGIRLSPAGLEIGARIGPLHLRTVGGVATITTGLEFPEAAKTAAVGRALEDVFDHAILRGRGYVVEDQYDRVPTMDDPREAWRIEFGAEPVPWRVPWAGGSPPRMP